MQVLRISLLHLTELHLKNKLYRHVWVVHVRRLVTQLVPVKFYKEQQIIKPTMLKVVAVAYLRWSFTRGSDYSDFTSEIDILKKWSLTRGVRSGRFDSSTAKLDN